MIIYFTRHGHPDYYLDVLKEKGRMQAEKTSEFLSKENIEKFYVSSAGRARETAMRTLEKVEMGATIVPWMEEGYLAKYALADDGNGEKQWIFWLDRYVKRFTEIKDDPNWENDDYVKEINLDEGVKIENNNVDEWFKSMGIIHDREKKRYYKESADTVIPGKIGVFAHGGMAFAFLSSILDETYPHFMSEHKNLDMCGVAILEIFVDEDKPSKLLVYNKLCY